MTYPTESARGSRQAFALRIALAAILVVVALFVAACQNTGSTASPTAAPAGTKAPAGTAAPGGGQTVAQLASTGKNVYSQNCAACHGDQGQGGSGPALWGSSAKYGRFANAKEVDSYVRTNMPQSAPGSLSADQYNQVVAYVLQQAKILKDSDSFNDQTLTATTNLPK